MPGTSAIVCGVTDYYEHGLECVRYLLLADHHPFAFGGDKYHSTGHKREIIPEPDLIVKDQVTTAHGTLTHVVSVFQDPHLVNPHFPS